LTIDELLQRARWLDGATVGELARRLGEPLEIDPRRTKGRIGELVERALGASAGNLDLPDFPQLGVELKTVPLDRAGRVRESTFVCALDLAAVDQVEWETSRVWRKLCCVLWVPVEAASVAPLPARHIGTPMLWRPSPAERQLLADDWHELVGRIAVGGVEEVTAHLGQALQVRPKAKNSAARGSVSGPDGESLPTVPLGFYLRARFTEQILWEGIS
jgi:DNA mismatch repair protein MutH